MKFKGLIMLAGLSIALSACSQSGMKNVKLETQNDSLSYALGVNIYNDLKTQANVEIDPLTLAKGIIDTRDSSSIFSIMEAQQYFMTVMRKRQEESAKLGFKDVIDEGEKFLAENKDKEGVTTTESGLQYKVITMGEGAKPAASDKVDVHYTGTLIDGTVFDSSVEKGESIQFSVGGVIPGWTEGLQLMPVGSKFMFYIPNELAYGARGAGATIKPYSTLIFEVELLDIITE